MSAPEEDGESSSVGLDESSRVRLAVSLSKDQAPGEECSSALVKPSNMSISSQDERAVQMAISRSSDLFEFDPRPRH